MRLGSIKGIELAINPLFLLVCLAYLLLGMGEIFWVILALVLHEAGHALVAMLFGFRLLRIELFPFGGQISTEVMVGNAPGQDVMVALAGPIVSLFSAGLTYIIKGNLELLGFSFFMEFNLLLGMFNLLPALPLDGGRVFKALFSMKVGVRAATVIGSWSGLILAMMLVITGVYLSLGDPRAINLLLVAGFLGYKAHEELQMLSYSFIRYLLQKKFLLAKNDGMAKGFLIVARGQVKVSSVLNCNLPQAVTIVLVIDVNGKVRGILMEQVLIEAMLTQGPATTLEELLSVAVIESEENFF